MRQGKWKDDKGREVLGCHARAVERSCSMGSDGAGNEVGVASASDTTVRV